MTGKGDSSGSEEAEKETWRMGVWSTIVLTIW